MEHVQRLIQHIHVNVLMVMMEQIVKLQVICVLI
jgi:hypothetical protein